MAEPKAPVRKSTTAPVSPVEQEVVDSGEVAFYKDGYYRTHQQVIVNRRYLNEDGDYVQSVAQDVNGQLPEGITNKDITND